MNIVLDNIIFSLQKAGGISVVWQNLIKNLLLIEPTIKFIEYENNNIFRRDLTIDNSAVQRRKNFSNLISQFINPIISSNQKFIFHSSYFRLCPNPKAINVTTVHDFIYEQGHPTLSQKIRMKLNHRAIRGSDAIVCISENTKKDLMRFLPDINAEKVSVIYNGVSLDYKPLDKCPYLNLNDCILFVGGRQGYKNFRFLVDSIKNTKYRLVICGQPLTSEEKEILEKEIPGKYLNFEYPTNEDLNKIYNSVFALVYPSSYEGFGIPVLEAQRAGCPVIALNSSSIPEVMGDKSMLMNQLTKTELCHKLSLLEDINLREKSIKIGLKFSQKFSWEKMSEEYFKLYAELLKSK